MLKTKHLPWALMLAVGWLGQPSGAQAQGTQPTADGYALYDRLAPAVITRSGVDSPEAADTGQTGCQRYAQAAAAIIRFAFTASLPAGQALGSANTEARQQTAELIVNDAQSALSGMASTGATTAQCAGIARAFGAQAFSLALSINRANVQRNAQLYLGPPPKATGAPEKSAEDIAVEEAAKAAADRAAADKLEAERLAADKVEHAFANLPPNAATPAPADGQAQPLSFNIYLLDNPAARAAKDFRLCFEPALYQRAARPMVDLAAAAFEVPAAEPITDDAATAFFDQVRKVIAARFRFPADRLFIQVGEEGAVKGPVAQPVKAVAAGCHVYLAIRTPTLAYDDTATSVGLLARDVIEDRVLRPALDARLAALPRLDPVVSLEAPAPAADPASPPAARPEIVACLQDARCRAGAQVAVNACRLTADRRLGNAIILRELEARRQATAFANGHPDDDQAARDRELVFADLELINSQLQQTLERLQDDRKRVHEAARAVLLTQELDAAFTAGRAEGEQSMGAPSLQCYARLADGRAVGLAPN